MLLPTRMQVGMLTALAQSASPGSELVDLSGHTTPKRARNALAMAVSERAGLNAASPARAGAAHAVAAADADMDGKRFKIGLVALVDSDQLRLFKALNAKAVITGTSRHAELARTLTTVDMYDAMRGSFAKLGNPSFAYGTASLVFASASLSELSRQYSKALPRERPLLGANFAAGVGALVGDSAMLSGLRCLPSGEALGDSRCQSVEVLPRVCDVIKILDVLPQQIFVVIEVLTVLDVVVLGGEGIGLFVDHVVNELSITHGHEMARCNCTQVQG